MQQLTLHRIFPIRDKQPECLEVFMWGFRSLRLDLEHEQHKRWWVVAGSHHLGDAGLELEGGTVAVLDWVICWY